MKLFKPILILLLFAVSLTVSPIVSASQGFDFRPNQKPDANEILCSQIIDSDFDLSVNMGLNPGDEVPAFKFYTTGGDSILFPEILQERNKSLIIINGSFSSIDFRNSLPEINRFYNNYSSVAEIWIAYTIEARPSPGVSPYCACTAPSPYPMRQALTYGQRESAAVFLTTIESVFAPVFLDGTCNEYWFNIEPLPNAVICLKPNDREICYKQLNFNYSDLEANLGTCGITSNFKPEPETIPARLFNRRLIIDDPIEVEVLDLSARSLGRYFGPGDFELPDRTPAGIYFITTPDPGRFSPAKYLII